MDERELAQFVMRVLAATAGEHTQDLLWLYDGEYAPITFFIGCNDLFYWACADGEQVTPDNIATLEQAYRDSEDLGWALFCCRCRGMRPQGPFYKYIPEAERPLFDACGPCREDQGAT